MIAARQPGVLAGLDAALLAFELLDPALRIERLCDDGGRISRGDVGRADQRPGSGRARRRAHRAQLCAAAVGRRDARRARWPTRSRGTKAQRSSAPARPRRGLRILEKEAVRLGGGANHRFGLDDAMLIKDNHIAMAAAVAPALEARQARAPAISSRSSSRSTPSTSSPRRCAVGVDAVLLDNMTPETLRRAVEMVDGRAITEASGRITRETAAAVAATGVDLISSRLDHPQRADPRSRPRHRRLTLQPGQQVSGEVTAVRPTNRRR